MAKKTFNWTVDVDGGDFGGRTNGTIGIDKGLPLIFKLFREHDIKGLFFVSTEALERRPGVVQDIINQGHEVGNHGHFHVCFKESWRQVQNKNIADNILRQFTNQDFHHFRAPKFSYKIDGHRYSDSYGHVGLLKQMWLNNDLRGDEIFYLHPFDIVSEGKSPNLFCSLWYSKPRKAYETLIRLVTDYPGRMRLVKNDGSL